MTEEIKSLKNPKVKEAAFLNDRRHREKTGLFLIEGEREIRMAMEGGADIFRLFYCKENFSGSEDKILKRASAKKIELISVTPQVFQKMVYREKSSGLLAVAKQHKKNLKDIHLSKTPLLIVVENAEKPGNLGAIFRSADAAGVDGVIICGEGTDIYNPNVVRASMGTVFTVASAESSAKEIIAWLRQKKISIAAAVPDSGIPHFRADLSGSCAIVMGGEHEGLRSELLNAAGLKISIPMKGAADSLNLSAATAVIIYEALRQRLGTGRD